MRRFLLLFVFLILGSFWLPSSVQAAVCSISTDTVVNQAYVTDNACTSINIEGNVSTTWIGTVDLGGGTVTVKTGYTMTMGMNSEMVLGASDDFEVEANATTTHTASDPNGLKITARNVTITGALSANAKGCSGSVSAAQDGYGPSLSTGICEYRASGSGKNGGGGGAGGSGGSHGGASSAAPGGGAAVTVLYGDSLNPTFLGSGGGNGYYTYSLGGAGGGRITLTVSGLLDVDGSIVANGGDGSPGDLPQYNGAGGGSGGSIAITAESISGSGIVSANGGKGGAGAWGGGGGGGGGGGRIFVAYNASTFTLSNIQAVMGTGGSANGKSGTTYILNRTVDDGGGALTITSGFDFPAAGDYTRESITIESGAYLTCAAASTLTVSSTAWLSLNTVTWACSSAVTNVVIGSSAGISTTGTSITFSSTDHFKISAPTWTNEETTMSVTKAGAYTTVDTSNDLSFDGFTFTGATNQGTTSALGGLLIFPNAHALSLVDSTLNTGVSSTVMTSIFIDADSVINANGRGCAGSTTTGNGFGPHLTTGVCTISTTGFGRAGNGGGGGGGGAAHGGAGGAGNAGGSAQTTTYGDEQTPVFPGSGGGGGYSLATAAGGNGGGRIFLHTSGEFALFGNMSANGAPGLYWGSWNGGGGGSGGSVYLRLGELSGTGVITANGGNGATGGGAGGGGRIAVAHGPDSSSVIANLSVVGGTAGSGAGGVGTIYTLSFSAPDASSIVSPATGSYNAALNPVLTSAAYGNSPGNLAHLSSDWKVTTDSDGLTLVWFATGDTVNKVSTQVNVVNGTFTGALTGQTALAASSTYYAFVRHTNSFGTAVWSSGISFATPYAGVSSTLPFLFDDQSPATVFNYDPDFIEINASGNGLARLKDLGGGTYVGVGLVGYPIYKELSILNNVAETFTNAQVSTTVVYASGMQSDFDDIRFTADDGVTLLDHYRVSKTDGVSAVFHIKVPSLPASATTIVRMYYGNADVASASDFLSTGQRSYVSDAGLRAEWLMDEGSGSAITDTSGNGNNGTYTYNGSGGWLGSDSRFSTGDATKYDGSGDAISTPVSITGLTDDFSLETWAYSDSDGSGWGWFFGESGGGTFLLGKTWFNSSLHYNMGGLGSGNTAAGTFTAGSWHHIVFSHDKGASNATKIYVNGSLVAAINAPAWSPTTAGNFILGARSNGETFTGKLDSARVYTRALSAAEVLAHYQSRSYFSTDPTVTFGAAQPSAPFAQSTISVSADGNHPSVLSVYRMEETLAPGSTGTVTYQLSVDGSTWKYWNGSAWATASDDTAYTNTSSTMNAYLPLFVSQVGLGDLYVRALFTSNGSQPVGLDALKFFYAPTNLSPDAPTLLGPASLVDGSTTSTVTPAFVFTLNDADGSDALKYQIQIDDSSDFSSPVIDYTSDLGDQGERSFRVGQAAGSGSYVPGQDAVTLPSGSYYWRVKAIDPVAAESSYTTANSGSMAFTIDSGTRTVSFAYSTMSSLESVTATSVRVVLDATHFENVTVNYSVTGGTATGSGTDYTLSSGTATITAGETSTTIAIVVVNDEIDEPDETFVITLADPAYATLGATDELTYTITDNDAAGITSSESAFSLSEGGASDTFTLVLTSKPTSTVTVTFTTSTAGITLVPDALAFTTDNWATPQTVTISATDDSRYESSHTTSVVMTVSGGVYGYPLITPPTITATITDNETSDITLSASTLAVTEGSFGTLTFVLASQPTSTVTLVFATPSESALSASSLTFTADNWSTSQMLTVNILNNRDYVGTRTATLTTTVTSDTTFSQVAVPTVTITINEDDAPPGGGAVTAGPGAFYVPFPLDYVPPVTTVPALPPQTGGEASSPAPVTDAPTAPSAPASNQARTQVSSDATSFRVTLAPQDQERLASFVDTGTSQATQALGSGERRALVRDALDTMGRAPTQTDLERLAQGQIPQTRNLTREREQLPRARSTFRTIYGRDPNFQNAQENLAWNTLMYRIRFTRDLAQEREGITTFRQTFRRAPSDPFQWAVVRVLGYVR